MRKSRRKRTDWKFTTPEQVAQDKADYWANKTVEERFLAVEMIREATYWLYHGRKLPRLARVYRITDAPPRMFREGRAKK